MIQMLHVNIFIVIGSLCAGLCDTASALNNLYYVLENTHDTWQYLLLRISPGHNQQIKRGRVSAQVPKYLLFFFCFCSSTVDYLHNCHAESLRNTLHLFIFTRERKQHLSLSGLLFSTFHSVLPYLVKFLFFLKSLEMKHEHDHGFP